MPTLYQTLKEYDYHLLVIIANRWDVDFNSRDIEVAVEALQAAMLDVDHAAHEWTRLSEKERGALQILLGATDHKMTLAKYERLYGEIRIVGEEKRKREEPHLDPVGMAETLYYRGLLSVTYDQGIAGTEQFVYVPHDLAAVLPTHEAGYDLSAPAADATQEPSGETRLIAKADTSIVDDLTTVLAYLQIHDVAHRGLQLDDNALFALEDYFIGDFNPVRVELILALCLELGLIKQDVDRYLKPNPDALKKWLDYSRTKQIETLVQAWLTSRDFNELYYVPHILYESGDNDPTLGRKIIQKFLSHVSDDNWFSLLNFVSHIKQQEPDFQRPGADYDSWYLRHRDTNEYLHGFENWDLVDGMVLYVALTGAMHWLGIIDLGENAQGGMVRLNAYGRAFAGKANYPKVSDSPSPLVIQDDGLIYATRHLSRYDRFQVARFTNWGMPTPERYEYKLTKQSLEHAHNRGIQAQHVMAFLKRASGDTVPKSIQNLLEQWETTGGAATIISQVTILETTTPQELDGIWDIPNLRRFLGRRLGKQAVIVREGQWQDLLKALQEHGILVETPNH